MARHSTFRASDADREHVAERLRKAAAEGRLLAEELEQRLGTALRARTYGELDALVVDLPGDRVLAAAQRSGPPAYLRRSAIALGAVVALAALLALLALIVSTIVVGGAWLFLGFWFFGCRRARYQRYAGNRWERSPGCAPWR